tara:strand:- start:99 stop:263 length:165 start_codon:yes stop_codon:yes gene_type:complete
MKVGDLVQYVDAELFGNDIGLIAALWFAGDREMVDVLWDNGVYTDDSYEFKVIS